MAMSLKKRWSVSQQMTAQCTGHLLHVNAVSSSRKIREQFQQPKQFQRMKKTPPSAENMWHYSWEALAILHMESERQTTGESRADFLVLAASL